jgi:hypothetical protein
VQVPIVKTCGRVLMFTPLGEWSGALPGPKTATS